MSELKDIRSAAMNPNILKAYAPSIVTSPTFHALLASNQRFRKALSASQLALADVDRALERYKKNVIKNKPNNWRKRHHIPMRRRDGRRRDIKNEWATRLLLACFN